MRVAVIADIHGNQLALEAILQDMAQQPAVDKIVIAGDLCLSGPCPKEVLEILWGLRCPVVKGNVDVDVATQAAKLGTKKRVLIDWTRKQIGLEGVSYLDSLPTSHLVTNPEGTDLLVVHANPHNLQDAIFPTTSDSILEQLVGDLPPTIGAMAFGHLHIAYTRRWRHLLLVDAGSCGLPRDEDPRAAYSIITWQNNIWQAELRRADYDLKGVITQMQVCGMPNAEKRIKILTEAMY